MKQKKRIDVGEYLQLIAIATVWVVLVGFFVRPISVQAEIDHVPQPGDIIQSSDMVLLVVPPIATAEFGFIKTLQPPAFGGIEIISPIRAQKKDIRVIPKTSNEWESAFDKWLLGRRFSFENTE